jgi:16S rRNA (guanine527-N7)-methyltransferase
VPAWWLLPPINSGAVNRSGDVPESIVELRGRVTLRVEQILHRSAELGFLGSMSVSDQIDHALGFVVAAESVLQRQPRSVVDMGAGGGVPGLVLLSCWPDSRLVLLDANERRTEFLSTETAGWDAPGTVEVLRGRAEEIGRMDRLRQQFDLVTSRSFGVPAVTAECGSPLLAVGGVMVVSEPPDGPDGTRWPVEGLTQVGLRVSTRVRFDDRFGYQVLVKSDPTPDRYPRRVGIPSKRPLF